MKFSRCRFASRALLAAAAALLIHRAPAHAAPPEEALAVTAAPPVVNTEQSYGDLGQRFVLYVWGKPSLLATSDIDELVGNPWQLSLTTEAKLATLRPRLRMEVYQFVSGNMHTYQFVPQSSAMANGHEAGRPWLTSLSPVAGRVLVRTLTSTALGHFRSEELVDLGVYSLSRQSFFPTSQREWSGLKQTIVRDDLLFGSAVALALASTDSLQARMSGLLVKSPGNGFRFGWFGEFRDLGFQLHPTLRAGFKAKSPEVQVSAGIAENFGVGPVGELRAFEVTVNNHWLEQVARPRDWELAVTALGRYVLDHQVQAKEGALHAALDLYFRRPNFAGSSLVSLLVRTNIATDFRDESGTSMAMGLEHNRYDVATLLRVGFSSDPLAAAQGGNVGVLIAGGLEPRLDRLRAVMFSSADAVAVRLDNLSMIKAKIARLDGSRAGASAELAIWQSYLQRGRGDLEAELAQYLADRDAFHLYAGTDNSLVYKRKRNTDGPLVPTLRQAAQREIGQRP